MPGLRIDDFSGVVPRTGPTQLEGNQAQIAKNVKLTSQELRPWREKSLVYTPSGADIQTIFKFQGPVGTNPIWLTWSSDVNIVPGPVADLNEFRLYYTSDSFSPKKTNWALASTNNAGVAPFPNAQYEMGVPAPTGAPTISSANTNTSPSATITTAQIAAMVVGDILNIVVDANAAVNVTLTAGTGGIVTDVSLAAQLNNVTGLTATVVGTGVTVKTVSALTTSQVTIKKKTGTTNNYDSTVVTYTTFVATVTGSSKSGASVTLTSTQIATLLVGDIVAVTSNSATYTTTLLAGTGNVVTAASLSAQLAVMSGLTSVVSGTSVVTTATSTVVIKRKTGTTYEILGEDYASAAATATISAAQIASLAPGDYLSVTVNSNPPVAGSVTAGSGTYPAAVTADSLYSSLNLVYGITNTINTSAAPTITIKTVLTGSTASFGIRKVVPRVDAIYTTLAQTTAVSAVLETRSYVYTYVTELGIVAEESAPSPATLATVKAAGDSVTISGFTAAPSGNYNFKYKRIYRSVIGATTSSYLLVAEIPIATSTYVDTKTVTDLTVTLTSSYFTPPPATLKGLVSMPNGLLAGFTGNQIWFCEPYLPHAWPSIYMLTTDYPIVGLGVFGNSLFVGTTRNPYMVTGTTPTSMAQEKLPMVQPCVSKKSIVSDQFGVLYASPNGLAAVAPGTQDVITTPLYTRDEWQAINPSTLIGSVYNNMYFGFYTTSTGARNSIVLKRADVPPLSNFDADAKAVFVEPVTGAVHYLSAADAKIYTVDTSTSANTIYQWKSKKFLLPQPANFAALQIHADYVYKAANAGSYVTVNIYADGTLVSATNATSDVPVRLPSASRSYYWEIELLGNVPVRRVAISTSVVDLKGV